MSTETRRALKAIGEPETTGQQGARILRLPRRPVPPRVRPLWQRHDLFLEPAYSGVEPYEDSEDGLEDEG